MQFTSPYPEDRIVPLLNGRTVKAGETVPVPADHAIYFVQTWRPADAEAEQAVDDYNQSLVVQDDEQLTEEEEV
jgi:hypothetical protein